MPENSAIYYQYIRDINKYPLLSKPEETFLLKKIQEGDTKAINLLVCSNLKFVINVAFMYRNQGLSLTELINEGNIGLITASKRFDPNQKIKFISYAVWWIRQSINKAINEKARVVRISAEKEIVLRKINRQHTRLRQIIGGNLQLDTDDIAEKMGYTKSQVEKILKMGQNHKSLDEPVENAVGISHMDMMHDKNAETTDEKALKNSIQRYISDKLRLLNQQEQKVLKMYYGISFDKTMSLEEIGDIIGLSKERVRQIKEKGLKNLRSYKFPRDLLLAA